jgi:hypothetical protein
VAVRDAQGGDRRVAAPHAPNPDHGSSTVRYQLRQARKLLADEGVVPWAAFDAGDLPAA